jgi:hypothetical protein
MLRTFPLACSSHSRRLDQLPYIKKLDQLLTDVMIDSLTRMFVLPRTMTVYRQEEPAVDFLDAAMLPRAILRLQVQTTIPCDWSLKFASMYKQRFHVNGQISMASTVCHAHRSSGRAAWIAATAGR